MWQRPVWLDLILLLDDRLAVLHVINASRCKLVSIPKCYEQQESVVRADLSHNQLKVNGSETCARVVLICLLFSLLIRCFLIGQTVRCENCLFRRTNFDRLATISRN